jgi:hypothetical protein
VLVILIGAQSAQLALAVHGSSWSWSWTWIRSAQCAVVGLLAWFWYADHLPNSNRHP